MRRNRRYHRIELNYRYKVTNRLNGSRLVGQQLLTAFITSGLMREKYRGFNRYAREHRFLY